MRICAKCSCPVSECQCPEEYKRQWERHARANWEEDMAMTKRNNPDYDISQDPYFKAPPLYEDRSFEIDDDIWPVIRILWDKGYQTRYCCAGHPNFPFSFYIAFSQNYYFDFTKDDFVEGWSYTRITPTLRFTISSKMKKRMEKEHIDFYEYLEKQRAFLLEWVKRLPPAQQVKNSERLPGIVGNGRIVPKEQSK